MVVSKRGLSSLFLFLGAVLKTLSPTSSSPSHPPSSSPQDGVEEFCSDSTCDEKEQEHYKEFKVRQIWKDLDCDTVFESPRPVHNQSTWMMLRGVYHGIVGNDKSSIGPPLTHGSGIRVPFHVKHSSPEKGRGVHAAARIEKGTLVWSASFQSARFLTGDDYRRFLYAIPVDVACDVIQWAYVLKVGEEPYICADLDEGSFLNTADKKNAANLGCSTDEICGESLYALRDIEEGEEFLCEYGDFAISNGWKWFGL